MDELLDKEFLKIKIQNILNKEFRDSNRKIIKIYPERFNFCCPCCGDSQKSVHKKRGNLYFNLRFKCFNCDTSMSFIKFCDKFNEQIEMDDRIKLYNYIDNHVKYTKTNEHTLDVLDSLIPVKDFVEFFNNHPRSWLVDIKPVEKNSHVYQYLKFDRLIDNFDDIYQGVYQVWREGKVVYKTRVMISLNKGEDMLLGIQLRNLEKDKIKRFYKIVEFEEIYNFMHPTEPLDEMEAISYNKLSHFFNILNVDFESKVTIFEGFIDSKFCYGGNSIGLVGAKNSEDLLKFLTESEDNLDLQFFFDNDVTGIKKAQEMMKKGFPIFLWNKLFEKLSEKKDYYTAKNKLEGIIDLNDMVKAANNPNVYDSLKLYKFFSKDEFDIYYVDKLFFDRENKTWHKK